MSNTDLRAAFVLCLIVAASSAIDATATSSTELIAQLRDAVVKKHGNESLNAFEQLRSALDHKNFDHALSLLGKISSLNQEADIQEHCGQLQSIIFAEKRLAAEVLAAEVQELLRKAGELCLAAQNGQDLDAVTNELADKREALVKLDCMTTREAIDRSEKALKFVQLWQKYLNFRLSDLVEAKARLIYLANIDISHLMIERSRLVTEIEKMPDPENKPPPPAAPSNVVDLSNADGSTEIFWTNNDESADGVIINKQRLDGKWLTLEELPPNVTSLHVPNPYLSLSR